MKTDVVPLSAFLIFISVLVFKSLSACCSAGRRLFLGFLMCISASWYLTLSRKLSKATDCCTVVVPSLILRGKDVVLYLAREICIEDAFALQTD